MRLGKGYRPIELQKANNNKHKQLNDKKGDIIWWQMTDDRSNGKCFWNGEAFTHGSRDRILNWKIKQANDLLLSLQRNSNRMWCLNSYFCFVFHHRRLVGLRREEFNDFP